MINIMPKHINCFILFCLTLTISCKKKNKEDPKPIEKIAETKIIDCNNVPDVFEDLGEGVDYIIGCKIRTKDQIITIKPGVTIQFEGKDAGMEIGDPYGFFTGALKMIGTAAKPIVLQGKSAVPGSWQGITLNGVNSENQWEHVTLRDAGSGEMSAGLFIQNVYSFWYEISIKNCSFINNLGYGISDSNGSSLNSFGIFSSFEKNKFKDNTKSPLRLHVSNIGGLDELSSYNNNGQDYIEVTGIWAPKYDVTIKKINVPYLITTLMEVRDKLIIDPGVRLQFAKDAGFYIMYYPTAAIIANGTADLPIVFQGFEPNIKAYWFGIELDNSAPSIFNYCMIDGAGSRPSRSDCAANEVKSAIHFGAKCFPQSGNGTVTNSGISNSGGHAITFQLGRDVTIGNNKYIGNALGDVYNY